MKAKKIRKKRKIHKPMKVDGMALFKHEVWESRIKPLIVEELGPDATHHRHWLAVGKEKTKLLWDELKGAQAPYNAKAQLYNTGKVAKEEKAR